MTSLCQCNTVYCRWGRYGTTDTTDTNSIVAARVSVLPRTVYGAGTVSQWSTFIALNQLALKITWRSLCFESICINSSTCYFSTCCFSFVSANKLAISYHMCYHYVSTMTPPLTYWELLQNGFHFAEGIFNSIFLKGNFCILNSFSKICSSQKEESLIHVMVWRLTGDEP